MTPESLESLVLPFAFRFESEPRGYWDRLQRACALASEFGVDSSGKSGSMPDTRLAERDWTGSERKQERRLAVRNDRLRQVLNHVFYHDEDIVD
jgi:hypothetical protein